MTSSSAGHLGPPDTDDTAVLSTTHNQAPDIVSNPIASASELSTVAGPSTDQTDSTELSMAPSADQLQTLAGSPHASTNAKTAEPLPADQREEPQQQLEATSDIKDNFRPQPGAMNSPEVRETLGTEDVVMADTSINSPSKGKDQETLPQAEQAVARQAEPIGSQDQPNAFANHKVKSSDAGDTQDVPAESSVVQPAPEQHTQDTTSAATAMPAPADVSAPPSTPFTPVAMSNLDTHAYYMMALAMSQNQPAMSPPPTVTPSQVTLPPPDTQDKDAVPYPNSFSRDGGDAYKLDEKLESFARLEFQDSVFQITTYAVIIGRDQQALEQARRDERRQQDYQRRLKEAERLGHPPPSPPNHKNRPKFSKSYVSEEGGMLGPASDNSDDAPPAKKRKTSVVGSEHAEDEAAGEVVSDRQYVSHTPGAAAVDLEALRPSQDHVPFIGIHSPGPNIASKTKAISREHLKIEFNREEGVFEARPMHKNGFFCQDVHYKDPSQPVVLRNGDRLQIKDVGFKFVIPGVAKGLTGAEPTTSGEGPIRKRAGGGKEMSFDFDDSREMRETSEEPLSELDESMSEISNLGQEFQAEEQPAVKREPAASLPQHSPNEGSSIPNGQHDILMHDSLSMDAEGMLFQVPRKRGPGRPPKNGIMSKREQRLLKKQQQEMARKTLPEVPPPPMEAPIKRKVGRPRKHPLPEDGNVPEKRKYKPRKPREDGGEGSDPERKAKEKKDKKVRPKSPPLELRIGDFTEEQLQKPNKNYGVLIDETLTAAPDGLTLKQIYKRICQRYPWFYFHTETKGWESSVRHNLIGNDAFKKDEVSNLWFRVPGVELDAGKKRKPTSPDRTAATHGYGHYAYGYGAPHMPTHGMPQGQVPPGYPMPAYNGQPPPHPAPVRPAQVGPAGSPNQPNQPAQVQPQAGVSQPPGHGHLPPTQGQYGVSPQGSYNSPYAQRPPLASAAPGMKTEEGSVLPQQVHGHPQISQARPTVHPPPHGTPTQGVTQPQVPRQTSGTPGRISEPPQPPKPVIDTPLLSAVVNLRQGLNSSLQKARNPLSDDIVFSAMSRCLGFKTTASGNEKMEGICIKGITQVMDGYLKNKPPPAAPGNPPQGSNAADFTEAAKLWNDAPKIMDFQPFHRLLGFKKVTIQSLTPALGYEMAECIALSAINRALGFFDTSIPAAKKPKDPKGNEIRVAQVETNLIKSIRHMLLALGYTIPDTTTGQ